MRRVLAFRHVPFEGLGRIEPELRERGIQADYADLYQPGAPSPDLANYAALIVLGGPMSIHDDLDHLRREESYIREAIARGTPVLGVCLGAQLIAHSLGAEVRKNPVKEIGWFELNLTTAAQHDPVFAGLGPRESVFHWHGEMFDLPAGAELLASSRRCANQAFRIGRNVYGFQFHLEATPEMIANWCREDERSGDREFHDPIDSHAHAARLAVLSHLVFGRWCDNVVRRVIAERA